MKEKNLALKDRIINKIKNKITSTTISRLSLLLLFISLALIANVCNKNTESADQIDPEVQALLQSLGENVFIPIYSDFKTQADDLTTKVAAYRQAVLTSGDKSGTLTTARNAFKTAMQKWQEAEILQVGPAGATGKRLAAQDIRDKIYSYPNIYRCRIDIEVVADNFENTNFFSTSLINAYGFAALEYLLFNTSNNNACGAAVIINTGGSPTPWENLSPPVKEERRARYAAAVAAEIANQASILLTTWQNSFSEQLKNAGLQGSVYQDQATALSEVFAAMFYIDKITKDLKLAKPLELTASCDSTSGCPDGYFELNYAQYTKEAIIANLVGFQKIFLGGPSGSDGMGFDDYLVSKGFASVSTNMQAKITAALGVAQSISGSLLDSAYPDLGSAPTLTEVQNLYNAVKDITDILKGDMRFALNLKAPADAAGDSD